MFNFIAFTANTDQECESMEQDWRDEKLVFYHPFAATNVVDFLAEAKRLQGYGECLRIIGLTPRDDEQVENWGNLLALFMSDKVRFIAWNGQVFTNQKESHNVS